MKFLHFLGPKSNFLVKNKKSLSYSMIVNKKSLGLK